MMGALPQPTEFAPSVSVDASTQHVIDLLSTLIHRLIPDRDASHAHQHMHEVTILALSIAHHDMAIQLSPHELRILTIACMIHDIADHKYVHAEHKHELQGQVHDVLMEQLGTNDDECALIDKIVACAGYSYEKKNKADTYAHLDTPTIHGSIIRHILSDADKLYAIGWIGMQRTLQYSLHTSKDDNNSITRAYNAVQNAVEHAYDKLLRLLPDGYIRTEYGRKLAQPLHDELKQYVEYEEKHVVDEQSARQYMQDFDIAV